MISETNFSTPKTFKRRFIENYMVNIFAQVIHIVYLNLYYFVRICPIKSYFITLFIFINWDRFFYFFRS